MKRLLCLILGHTGQERGGTLIFTCTRCQRSRWQKPQHAAQLAGVQWQAERMIAEGRLDESIEYAQAEVHRVVQGRS